jgi:hypothetical protein
LPSGACPQRQNPAGSIDGAKSGLTT